MQFRSRCSTRIKLVAIAKDEGPYLAEWIFHHLTIGIDAIEIWVNNTTDNSHELLRLIAEHDKRVSFFSCNSFASICVVAKSSLQEAVYQSAFETARANGIYTHILFLDLDEFLISMSPFANIKSHISKYSHADIFSFLWYTDFPSRGKKPFANAIRRRLKFIRHSHLKSMGRLNSTAITKAGVHNFETKENVNCVNVLANGLELHAGNTTQNRAILNMQAFAHNTNEVEPWFIYHRIYKSRLEYCISLLRGRAHNRDYNPLKTNRWGFPKKIEVKESAIISNFSDSWLKSYQARRKEFIYKANIASEILTAVNLAKKRYGILKALVRNNPDIARKHSSAFRGTKLEKIASTAIFYDQQGNVPRNSPMADTNQNAISSSHFKVAMPTEERAYLNDIYHSLNGIILEYGTGGSTILGLSYNNEVIGAETDQKWLEEITSETLRLEMRKKFMPCPMDIGKTKELGFPSEDYVNHLVILRKVLKATIKPWLIARGKGKIPQLVLIDGRFRMASFLSSLIYATEDTLILFDDYVDRSYYHDAEKILAPEKIIGRMAIFRAPKSPVPSSTIFEYLDYYLDPR